MLCSHTCLSKCPKNTTIAEINTRAGRKCISTWFTRQKSSYVPVAPVCVGQQVTSVSCYRIPHHRNIFDTDSWGCGKDQTTLPREHQPAKRVLHHSEIYSTIGVSRQQKYRGFRVKAYFYLLTLISTVAPVYVHTWILWTREENQVTFAIVRSRVVLYVNPGYTKEIKRPPQHLNPS